MRIPAPFDPKYVDFIRRIISTAEVDQPEWDPLKCMFTTMAMAGGNNAHCRLDLLLMVET